MLSTTHQFLSPADLTGDLRAGVIDLLYRLGDDALIIGHRNSEWTGIGPILEADIAFSSMAQDKMGHALAYYGLMHELGEPDADRNAYERGPEAFRCCSLVCLDSLRDAGGDVPSLSNNPVRDTLVAHGDWALAMVRQFFYSEADALRTHALQTSAYEPLAALARKLRGELKYHTMHGRTLLRRLAQGTDDGRRRTQQAIDVLYAHALGMFEPSKWQSVLADKCIAPSERELSMSWHATVEPLLTECGFTVPNDARPVFGGRVGQHPAALASILEAMQKVYRLAPGSTW